MPLVYRFIETFFVNDDRRALYIMFLLGSRFTMYSDICQNFKSHLPNTSAIVILSVILFKILNSYAIFSINKD